MPVAVTRNARPRPPRQGSGETPAYVILDSGDQARVVTVMLPPSPQPGHRFDFDGRTWEVIRAKDFQRGLVARPVRRLASVQ